MLTSTVHFWTLYSKIGTNTKWSALTVSVQSIGYIH